MFSFVFFPSFSHSYRTFGPGSLFFFFFFDDDGRSKKYSYCLSLHSRFVLTDHIRFHSHSPLLLFLSSSSHSLRFMWSSADDEHHWIPLFSNRWGTESNGASDQPPELGWLLLSSLFFRFRMIVCACNNNDVWLCRYSLVPHLHKWHGFCHLWFRVERAPTHAEM